MAGVIGWIADEDGLWDCGICEDCSAYGTKDCMANEDDLTIDHLYRDTDRSLACLIEDGQDLGFIVVKDKHGLYTMKHCPECHGNAMLTFVQMGSDRFIHRCRCGYKAWA